MSLTPLEEKSRCEATWQNFDEVLHGVMKCEGKFLRSRFANPDQAPENVRHTEHLCSDQVPVWIKSPVRQLDGKSEVKKKSEKVAPEATAMELPEQTEEPSSSTKGQAGDKGGATLSEWRKLRTKHPELFEQVSIPHGPEAYPLLFEQVSIPHGPEAYVTSIELEATSRHRKQE